MKLMEEKTENINEMKEKNLNHPAVADYSFIEEDLKEKQFLVVRILQEKDGNHKNILTT
jgi:hypothetical protein